MHLVIPTPADYSVLVYLSCSCSFGTDDLLVEEIQADAVVPLADNVVTEDGRIPAVASLFVVGLLAERLLSQAVSGGRL